MFKEVFNRMFVLLFLLFCLLMGLGLINCYLCVLSVMFI